MKKLKTVVSGLLCIALTFTACGKENPEITQYQNEVLKFCTVIEEAGKELSQIDFSSEESVESTLEYLKNMDTAFAEFAEITVPKAFISAEGLADDAYQYMTKASALYEETFQEENFNLEKAEEAYKLYKKAMNRIGYIANILEGKPIELKDGDSFAGSKATDSE